MRESIPLAFALGGVLGFFAGTTFAVKRMADADAVIVRQEQ